MLSPEPMGVGGSRQIRATRGMSGCFPPSLARLRGTLEHMDPQRLALASSVVVVRGAGFNPKKRADTERLAVETSLDAIPALARLLCDVFPGTDAAWMEWPTVSFAFVSEHGVLGEIGLLSDGRWARHVDVDLELQDPIAVQSWLQARGIHLP